MALTEFYPTREHEELEAVTETALIKVNPVNDPAVLALREEALKLQAYALSMVVADVSAAKMATDDLAALSKVKKAIEQKRKEWIDPISTHLAEVNQAFKQFTAPLEEADKCLRGKIMDWKHAEEERKRQIDEVNRLRFEAARLEAKANGGEITESVVILPSPDAPAKTMASDLGSSSTVKLRKWRLVDISQVPAEYLKVDEVAIGKLVRAGIPAIPGIEIYTEETLRINTRGE